MISHEPLIYAGLCPDSLKIVVCKGEHTSLLRCSKEEGFFETIKYIIYIITCSSHGIYT